MEVCIYESGGVQEWMWVHFLGIKECSKGWQGKGEVYIRKSRRVLVMDEV